MGRDCCRRSLNRRSMLNQPILNVGHDAVVTLGRGHALIGDRMRKPLEQRASLRGDRGHVIGIGRELVVVDEIDDRTHARVAQQGQFPPRGRRIVVVARIHSAERIALISRLHESTPGQPTWQCLRALILILPSSLIQPGH
jgi:hypothetical protein